MTVREALDAQMRELLLAIEVCSHVPAAQIGYSTGGSNHPSRMLAGGDKGAASLARRYDQARDDKERAGVIEDAKAELQLIRGRGIRDLPAGETREDTVARMLQETRGWEPEDVERSRFKMSARIVRRHRRAAGLHEETGHPLEERDDGPPPEERRARARELFDSGHTLSQIVRIVGASRSTIERDLGRRAA